MRQEYRVDPETGAVIFTRSVESKRTQQLKQRIETLEKEVEYLKKCNKRQKWVRR